MRKLVITLLILLAVFTVVTHVNGQELEIPAIEEGDLVYEYTGFVLSYNEEHEQAEWVAYHLTAEEVEGEFPRRNNFREDSQIPSGTATLDDYKRTGYDRGHLAPAGDMKWSEEAMSDSFYMSNMSPQAPGFNRIIWKNLEALVREWALENGELSLVPGPLLTDGPSETIGDSKVSIPKYYYKVILDYVEPEVRMIAFILPNKKRDYPLYSFVVTVDTVECVGGIDFFHLLPDDVEERLEGQAQYFAW